MPTEISNYDEWDGTSYLSSWSGTEYYGHRLLFSENTVIQKISFWVTPRTFVQEETVPYVAYLWEFDENTRDEVNPPVWYSNLLYTDNFSDSSTVNEVITDLGGIEVEANKTYLFSLVSANNIIDDNGVKLASTENRYKWAVTDLQNSDSLPETRSLTFHNGDTDFTIGQHNPSGQWSNSFGGDFIIKIVTGFPPKMSISSSDVSHNGSTTLSGVHLSFSSSEDTSDFTQDDIVISGGELVNFSGSGSSYSALLLVSNSGTYTIDIPEGVFSNNDASEQFVFKKKSTSIKFKKRTSRSNSNLTMDIYNLTEPSDNSILTNLRASFSNNLLSINEQLSLEDFINKNKQFPRAILYRIVNITNKAKFNSFQTVSNVYGSISNQKFIRMNSLLKESLGKILYNTYVVNQDMELFNNIGKVNHYLITDLQHIMNRLVLVLAAPNNSYLNDLTCPEHNSSIATNLVTLLGNDYKIIEVSSSSSDNFYSSNLNEGIQYIVDSINEQTSIDGVFSDYNKDINGTDNGACTSLGTFKLAVIPKVMLSYMRDLNYFKQTYYGLPVGVYGDV